MKRAVKRDAMRKESFHFRKSIIPSEFKWQNFELEITQLSTDNYTLFLLLLR